MNPIEMIHGDQVSGCAGWSPNQLGSTGKLPAGWFGDVDGESHSSPLKGRVSQSTIVATGGTWIVPGAYGSSGKSADLSSVAGSAFQQTSLSRGSPDVGPAAGPRS